MTENDKKNSKVCVQPGAKPLRVRAGVKAGGISLQHGTRVRQLMT